MERKDELTLLGSKTEYRQDYAPEVLESFVNKHPGNDYWVRFNLSLIHISEPTRQAEISYAVFC